ncbi:MAG: hypothetical protein V7704_19320 [Aurantimonas endophytica]|uniref:hypothetical protein n=1 Tax=Aurantimonas endophytica TaxID=1522175 RepID=UPI0030032579
MKSSTAKTAATPAKTAKTKKSKGRAKTGPDGTIVEARRIRTGTEAVATFRVRCRPGTFEWRYGRFGNAQYHAGADFARTWERAGIALAGGLHLEQSSGGSGHGGLSDRRMLALDRIRGIAAEIGGPMTRRLVSYCVDGCTPKEIAATYRHQVTDRQVSDTLDLDLHELAKAMNYA